MQTGARDQRRSLRQSWKWIAVLWAGFALVNATQIVAGMRAVGMQHAWTRLFLTVFASWIVWALATPFILLLGRRFPPTQWRSARVWAIHFAACIAVGGIYGLWAAALQMALQPWQVMQVTQFGKTAFYVFYGEFHLFSDLVRLDPGGGLHARIRPSGWHNAKPRRRALANSFPARNWMPCAGNSNRISSSTRSMQSRAWYVSTGTTMPSA